MEGNMVALDERVDVLEKDMVEVKACVDVNLTGERSVWAALEKLTLSIAEFEKQSENDRKEIRDMVHDQAVDAAKMSTAYAGMAGTFKVLGGALIVAIIGILVGLLTHTIQIG
jgi:hypothetical protein